MTYNGLILHLECKKDILDNKPKTSTLEITDVIQKGSWTSVKITVPNLTVDELAVIGITPESNSVSFQY